MATQLLQSARTPYTHAPGAPADGGLRPTGASKPATCRRSGGPVSRAGQSITWLGAGAGLTLLCGCDPTINFYGSFFPAWTWCLLLGLLGTILLRFVFAALRLERNLGPLVLVYPCLLLLLACVAWLALFRY